MGDNGPGKLGEGHHARLHVDMSVDQAGTEKIAAHIDNPFGPVVTEPDNPPLVDGDILPFDLS